MGLIAKLVISLLVAAVAATVTTLLPGGIVSGLVLFAAFSGATLLTALLVSLPLGAASTGRAQAPTAGTTQAKTADTVDGTREYGQVKWFNVTKGFGFIIREDGEEIFVHFRSIRGEGRRGLRDGQRVSFVVAQSEKGPQAEDVEGL